MMVVHQLLKQHFEHQYQQYYNDKNLNMLKNLLQSKLYHSITLSVVLVLMMYHQILIRHIEYQRLQLMVYR